MSQESKIISLRGEPLPSLERNEDLVAFMAEIFEKADSGEIIGCAIVLEYADQSAGTQIVGATRSFTCIGGLMTLVHRFTRRVNDS